MCPGSSSWSVAESELVWVERLHAEPPSYTHTPLIQEPGHRKGLNLPLTRATRSQETTESDRGSKDAAGEVGGSPDAAAGPRCPATASRPWALARAEGSRLNCSAQTRVVGGYVGHHLRRCYIDRKDNKGHSSETESPLRARRQAGQHRANAVSRCRCGSPTRLGSCAGPAPGRLVKMHILIQRVWDGAAGSLTHPLRMRKMLVEGPRLRKQQHGPGHLRLGGGSQRPAERRGGPLEHVRQEVRRHGVSAGCWGAACTRRRRNRKQAGPAGEMASGSAEPAWGGGQGPADRGAGGLYTGRGGSLDSWLGSCALTCPYVSL